MLLLPDSLPFLRSPSSSPVLAVWLLESSFGEVEMDLRLCTAELDPEHEAAESDSLSDALELLAASDPSMAINHSPTAHSHRLQALPTTTWTVRPNPPIGPEAASPARIHKSNTVAEYKKSTQKSK